MYGYNLGVIGFKTGSIEPLDGVVAITSAMLTTHCIGFPPQTINECKLNIGMQVAAGGLMLGRVWYKIANRPVPLPAPGGQRLP